MTTYIKGFLSKAVAQEEAKNTLTDSNVKYTKVILGKPLKTFLGEMERWDVQVVLN